MRLPKNPSSHETRGDSGGHVSLRQLISQVKVELMAVRQASKMVGRRNALVARARLDLDLQDVSSDRVAELEARLKTLEAAMRDAIDFSDRIDAIEQQSKRIGAHLGAIEIQSNNSDRVASSFSRKLEDVEAFTRLQIGGIERRAASAALVARIDPVTAWIASQELPNSIPISVILATRNRCELLDRAIASVRKQRYPNWELIVIDDGSTDGTPELLTRVVSEDDRITVITLTQSGVGSARNFGLEAATGDVICYLDDDNEMQPLWLKSVAWSFGQNPDLEFLYGARIVEVDEGVSANRDTLPALMFESFDRSRLEVSNFIDLGVIAHLRELEGARFDESLHALGDWDLILRLTTDRSPLPLPVVASMYTTSSDNRISHSLDRNQFEAAIQARMLRERERPLRVLAYNSLFPLVTETYVADEMKALSANGMVLAWCTDHWSPSPARVVEPLYVDLDTAVEEFEPDVLFIFWAVFCASKLDDLTRIGKPFALRVHSFDFDLDLIDRVRANPLCLGIWAYPHHATQIEGSHPLVALVRPDKNFPEPTSERPIVLSVSAAVPKRDWPVLVATFAELARKGVDCRIIVGITDQAEQVLKRIRELIRESGAAIMMSIDVPHDQVIELLSRTAVVVYTKEPGHPFGMPLSIIEGMCAGSSVIVPAYPDVELVAGPNCRAYVDKDDIVRHTLEILAGGPEVEAEQAFNREFGRAHFADPALGTMFAAQLARAVAKWPTREKSRADTTPHLLGASNEGPPHAIVPANTRYFETGPVTVGLEYRVVNDSVRAARFGNTADFKPLGTEFEGFSIHVIESATGIERLRFDHFPGQWHYHYMRPPHVNIRVGYDEAAFGPMIDWSLRCLTTRLPQMLATAGASDLVKNVDPEDMRPIVDEIRNITSAEFKNPS
jgi:glycosyltransferase involved in cell wall biosynthesis